MLIDTVDERFVERGGKGSGNWGHGGLAGVHGGSSSSGGGRSKPANENERNLRDSMRGIAGLMADKGPASWEFPSLYHLVLEHGEYFNAPETDELPDEICKGEMKMCFMNATKAILDSDVREEYDYVEGFAITEILPFPVGHAWLVDKKGNVIDPTWGKNGVAYMGIQLDNDWVIEQTISNEYYGVFPHDIGSFEVLEDGLPQEAFVKRGGQGSGNFGHGGLAGVHGGSSSSGGGGGEIENHPSRNTAEKRKLQRDIIDAIENEYSGEYEKIEPWDISKVNDIKAWIAPNGDIYRIMNNIHRFSAQELLPYISPEDAFYEMLSLGFARVFKVGDIRRGLTDVAIQADRKMPTNVYNAILEISNTNPNTELVVTYSRSNNMIVGVDDFKRNQSVYRTRYVQRGGQGSGNFGHQGLAGVHGGSSSVGGGGESVRDSNYRKFGKGVPAIIESTLANEEQLDQISEYLYSEFIVNKASANKRFLKQEAKRWLREGEKQSSATLSEWLGIPESEWNSYTEEEKNFLLEMHGIMDASENLPHFPALKPKDYKDLSIEEAKAKFENDLDMALISDASNFGDSVERIRHMLKTRLNKALDSSENGVLLHNDYTSAGTEVRAAIKNNIAKDLSEATGLSESDISNTISGWATSSNWDKESLEYQEVIRELFDVPRSEWQQRNLDRYKEHTGVNISPDEVDKKIVSAVYDNTQEWLDRSGFGDTVLLYRGISLPKEEALNYKTGEEVQYVGNIAESWTIDEKVARQFGSVVFSMEVPKEFILSTARTGSGAYFEGEMLVLGSAPGQVAMVNNNDFEKN